MFAAQARRDRHGVLTHGTIAVRSGRSADPLQADHQTVPRAKLHDVAAQIVADATRTARTLTHT